MRPTEDPYRKIPPEQLILRDHLAADRTVLANERTLLAYVRTSLALVIGGISLVKFFDNTVLTVLGWALVPTGLMTLGLGVRSFLHTRRRCALLDQNPPKE
jgi:putative membrane protein